MSRKPANSPAALSIRPPPGSRCPRASRLQCRASLIALVGCREYHNDQKSSIDPGILRSTGEIGEISGGPVNDSEQCGETAPAGATTEERLCAEPRCKSNASEWLAWSARRTRQGC